jgi:hypothetical protein
MEGTSTSKLYFPEVIDKDEFKRVIDNFLGYMVMNHCICGDMCNIRGEEVMIHVFNKYMKSLRDRLWDGLNSESKSRLMEYRVCKKINVLYEYKDGVVSFGSDVKKRVDMVNKFNEEVFVRYGILRRKYNEYYILSSGNLFTWSNVHKISVNDVIRFITYKRSNIILAHLDCVVELLRLFGMHSNVILDKLQGESDPLELVSNSQYRSMYNDFVEILRCIFWVYRKMVVDNIIGDSIKEVTRVRMKTVVSRVMEGATMSVGEVDGVSVGSTKLLSDYDVTLYGNFKLMSEVIGEFNRVMDEIYGNTSEVIFDTNVYGTSFIKLSGRVIFDVEEDKYLYKEGGICKGDSFMYMRGDSVEVRDMQHMWAFMKVLKALKMIEKFDVRLYESLYKYMELNLVEGEYLRKAASFMSFLNRRRDYVGVLGSYGKLIKSIPNVDRVLLTNMYISLVNYYGSETYYTRGAFLDVVVNQQMCGGGIRKLCEEDDSGGMLPKWVKDKLKKKGRVEPLGGEAVKLSESELMDSVIENIGEMMMHVSRIKYVDRVEGGIRSMSGISVDYCKVLREVRGIQRVCKEMIESCGVYVMLHRCVWLLVGVFNEYIRGIDGVGKVKLGVIKDVRGVI